MIITPLLLTAFIAIAVGLLLRFSFRHAKEPEFKHAMVCVALVWLVLPALSSLLFIMIEDMSPLDSFFEAINHAMTAIGTGGFTITDKSMAGYNNFLIELAVIPVMILGALPF